jgi:hypothetical protein
VSVSQTEQEERQDEKFEGQKVGTWQGHEHQNAKAG